ncbi:unnamed protein product [Orchesella dallaii]|uniref:G-protein coupled receptor Mth2 n=1 Tax=Orchesella dallaii TaxID=48710 RepID=A0ABP1Q1M9_9HEXA
MAHKVECVVIFTLLLSYPINTTVIYQCQDLHEGRTKGESGGLQKTLIFPPHLMSHFEPAEFRVLPTPYSACNGLNYDIVKISLIEPNNTEEAHTTESSTFNDEQVDTLDIKSYDENFQSQNGSYETERFVYTTQNTTETTILETDIPTCNRKLSRKPVQFTPTGFLLYHGEYFWPKDYCVQSLTNFGTWLTIKKCKIDCNDDTTPCISLCCHLHEYVDLEAACCQETLGPEPVYHPVIYEDINRRLSLEETILSAISAASNTTTNISKSVRPHYVTFKYHETCPNGHPPHDTFFNDNGDSVIDTRFHVQSNGKIAYIGLNKKWKFLESYCVAGIVNMMSLEEAIKGIKDMTGFIKYCMDGMKEPARIIWPHYIYISTYSVASVFLLLTATVYIILWDKQNIHGWTIISFVISQFFLFIFLSVSTGLSLVMYQQEASKTFYCIGSAVLAHFFFLSTFCWLTIINLDLWWTFKSLTPLSERSKGKGRFCLYMLFAWGTPTTVVTTGFVLQKIYKNNLSKVIVPDYGNQLCLLAANAKGVYLYYIIGALLFINLLLVSLTFYTIYQFKKSTRMATSSSSKNKERSFKLFVKLVILMGVTWTLEFIDWITYSGATFTWYFFAVDVFNILQAVAIFIIFVCKRKILNQLEQKYPSLRVITRPALKLMSGRSMTMQTSTDSKPTRSTTMASSIVHGSRNRSQKSSASDTKL